MTDSPRVLAIHAHPDDVEFQCAGTLALLARAGCHLTIATMTPGDCGSVEHGPEAIAAIRRVEALSAASLLGAECVCLEFRDLAIFEDDLSRRRVVECLRKARPDLVLTAPPVDYLVDHEVTSRLVRDACFCAPMPNYATGLRDPAPPLRAIPHLYFVDPIGGVDRNGQAVSADFVVDISEVFTIKREMLARHASQRGWLRAQHGTDEYLDVQDAWARARGAEIGVAHAEGFRQYLGHPYPASDRLRELLDLAGG